MLYRRVAVRRDAFSRAHVLVTASILGLALVPRAAVAQEPTPVPDVSVTGPKTKPSGSPRKKRSAPTTPANQSPGTTTSAPAPPANGPASPPGSGTVAAGYRVDTIKNVGPFTDLKMQDTPYSFMILSSEFIDNTQSWASPGAFADKLPSVQFNYTDQRPVTGVGTFRGIAFNTNQQLIDGLPVPTTSSVLFLEPFERIEAMSSLSGFMYGVGSSAGMFNYVLKRPTASPYESITIGAPDGRNIYVNGDVGGTTKDGVFGYRLNLVEQDGNTIIDDQSLKKGLVSGAFDYRPSDRVLLQVDASYSDYHQNQLPPTWSSANGSTPFPPAVNPYKNWGEPWTYADVKNTMVGFNLSVNITDNITSRSAVRYIDTLYNSIYINNFFNDATTTYTQRVNALIDNDRSELGGYQFFDMKFDTFAVKHKLTVGYYEASYLERDPKNDLARAFLPETFSLSSPTYVPNPGLIAGTQSTYFPTRTTQRNWTAGDQIDFNKYLSAIVGVTYANIDDNSYDTSNAPTNHYEASRATPTYALIYKPTNWLSTYVSYVEALQEGTVVGPTFTNAGQITAPYLRTQWEWGAKATVGNLFMTLALFDIDSALQYSITNPDGSMTFNQDGRQRNRGIETTITGEVAPGLRVLGGFTLLDDKVVSDPGNPQYVGTRVQGVSDQLWKLTGEYDLPYLSQAPFLQGFTLTGGVYYTSNFFGDQLNTDLFCGRTIFDAGFRYTTSWEGHPLIYRFTVTNLTDVHYWLGLYSGNTLGDPRRFTLSAQMKF